MLILTRQVGEQIKIGDDITITLVAFNPRYPGYARIGIDAPDGVAVHREEVHKRIQEEREHERLHGD